MNPGLLRFLDALATAFVLGIALAGLAFAQGRPALEFSEWLFFLGLFGCSVFGIWGIIGRPEPKALLSRIGYAPAPAIDYERKRFWMDRPL